MDKKTQRNPLLIIISSPSGAGKTSICRKIISLESKIKISTSVTTRVPRDNEVDGVDYYFISNKDFQRKIKNNELIEYAEVFGNYYGTVHKNIEDSTKEGNDLIFDIDWQGAQQLVKSKYKNIITIFILPPSKDVIEKRLIKRQVESGDNKKTVQIRMSQYETEISHQNEYDYIIVNDNFDKCIGKILKIIEIERLKSS